MTRTILLLSLLLGLAVASPADARTAHARIARITTAVATMQGVDARLDWPADADSGDLVIHAERIDAADLGYHYRNVAWSCRLQRADDHGWACAGDVRGNGGSLHLGVRFDDKATVAELAEGNARIALHRDAKTPDLTRLDFAKVPLLWAQALLAQAWADGKLKSGAVDGRIDIATPKDRPMRISGDLAIAGAALETPDGAIAADGIGGDVRIDYRKTPRLGLLELDARLRGGEFLAGNTYVALPGSPVTLSLDGMQRTGQGWELPRIAWRDGNVLAAEGSAAFGSDASLRALDLRLHSTDMGPLRDRYLSGWLGVFGLGNVELSGATDLHLALRDGELQSVDANLHGVDLREPDDRFGFRGLDGDVRFSSSTPVASELRWRSSRVYGLDFGAATLPFASENGELTFRQPVVVPAMGGTMTFEPITFRPPSGNNGMGDAGMDIRFALALEGIDFGQVSKALGLPAFQGTLSGNIPSAHYAGERLDFDGGLAMKLFDGDVRFSALSMERPFGVAPSLSADIDFTGLDLLRLTEVLDFGSITGRLDGYIHDLRLVDWTPVAFDAEMHSVRRPGVKQRISQRAVQNIGSVGDASFVGSLQGRLIGLFDDFGYARLGISCRLANEVCDMGGLHSSGNSFTIVEGAGLPRLDVVGFNRSVDWPTLVERLQAVGKGDVKPVVE